MCCCFEAVGHGLCGGFLCPRCAETAPIDGAGVHVMKQRILVSHPGDSDLSFYLHRLKASQKRVHPCGVGYDSRTGLSTGLGLKYSSGWDVLAGENALRWLFTLTTLHTTDVRLPLSPVT